MGLKGNLATVNLADVFQVLSRGNSTGLLRIMAPGDVRYVEIMDGSISIVSRPGSRVMLGDLLVARGLLKEEDLQKALERQKETGGLLGQVLVEMELVSREDIEAALKFQVEEEICDLFTIREGEFDFLANARVDSRMALGGGFIRLRIDPNNVLLEAARRMDEWPAIEERVPGSGALFRLTPKGLELLDNPEVEEEIKILLRLAASDRTFEAMVQKACLGRFVTGKIIAGLVDDGALELQPKEMYVKLGRLHLNEGRLDEAERVLRFAARHFEAALTPEEKKDLAEATAEVEKRKAAATQDLTGKARSAVIKRRTGAMARMRRRRIAAFAIAAALAALGGGIGAYFAFFRPEDPEKIRSAQAEARFSDFLAKVRTEVGNKNFAEAARLLREHVPEIEKHRTRIQEESDFLRQSADLSALADAEQGRKLLADGKKAEAAALCEEIGKRYRDVALSDEPKKALDRFLGGVRETLRNERMAEMQRRLDDMARNEASDIMEAMRAYRRMLEEEGVFEEIKTKINDRLAALQARIEEARRRLARAGEMERGGQEELALAEYDAIGKSVPGAAEAKEAAARSKALAARFEEAKRAFDAASALAAQGRTDEAIRAFEKFVRDHPASSLAGRVAASLAALKAIKEEIKAILDRAGQLEKEGDLVAARERYLLLLQKYPDSEEAKQVALPFEVRSVPAGAAVEVDGKAAGTTPASIRLTVREPHTIRVVKAGYRAEEVREINPRNPIIAVDLSKDVETSITVRGELSGRPAVMGDSVFSAHGMDLVALGGDPPVLLWRRELGERPGGGREGGIPPLAWPLVADAALYVCTGRDRVLRVDPRTGEGAPETAFSGRLVAEPLIYETPIVRDRKFLVVLSTGGIECLDLSSKQIKFSTPIKRLLNASRPSSNISAHGNRFFFGWYDACLYCVDFLDGRVVWSSPADTADFFAVHATPDGVVTVSSSGILSAFSLKDGSRVGRRDIPAEYVAAPASAGDLLIVANAAGLVTAISPDLRPKWSQNVEGRVECPLASDSDNVYVATQAGAVWALSRSGQVLWKLKVDGEPVRLAPAGRRLFVFCRGGTVYSTRIADK
ncbi:MAG: PQQ-binding-like beta-propeller repeat protein [Planctomycetota bacterium]|nr:PQQ-binding-like beta-propeller repeat protein [Planctomycetota bacterium]